MIKRLCSIMVIIKTYFETRFIRQWFPKSFSCVFRKAMKFKLLVVSFFIVVFLFSPLLVNGTSGDNIWIFNNSSIINFDPTINFSGVPYQGINNDSCLVGYWNMDEGFGSIVHDISGNDNNGTLVGSLIWSNGKYGTSINLNGDSNITVSNSPNINISNAITVSAWVKPNNISIYGQLISKEGNDGFSGVYSLRVDDNNKLTVRLSQGGSIKSVTTNSPQINSVGDWYHITFTYDGCYF